MWETILMAITATLIGTAVAFVLSFPAAANLAPNGWIYWFSRRFLEFCRGVPEILLALFFVFAIGIGPLAGVLAIAIHSAGALGKLFSEVNENASDRPIEGITAVGGTWTEKMLYGVVPQVMPNFFSYAMLRFEINVRASSIIGFVGAGGIGAELNRVISFYSDDRVLAVLILVVLMVTVIDLISERHPPPLHREGELLMSMASINAVDARADRGGPRTPIPGPSAPGRTGPAKWGPGSSPSLYVIGSMSISTCGLLFQASERALRLLRAMVVWEDMANWQYANIYRHRADAGHGLSRHASGHDRFALRGLPGGAQRDADPPSCGRACGGSSTSCAASTSWSGASSSCGPWGWGRWPVCSRSSSRTSARCPSSIPRRSRISTASRWRACAPRAPGPIAVIRYGYLPQVLPVFISQSLYFWESNTRSATILGIVGAGGIGMILIERFRASLYDQVAFVVLNVLVIIFAIDWLSKRIRLWAIGEKAH
jgi:phosphonate ABC transporter permease subunit PhnE